LVVVVVEEEVDMVSLPGVLKVVDQVRGNNLSKRLLQLLLGYILFPFSCHFPIFNPECFLSSFFVVLFGTHANCV
jgi:hypothetical protein